jgi:hypothetical protein
VSYLGGAGGQEARRLSDAGFRLCSAAVSAAGRLEAGATKRRNERNEFLGKASFSPALKGRLPGLKSGASTKKGEDRTAKKELTKSERPRESFHGAAR